MSAVADSSAALSMQCRPAVHVTATNGFANRPSLLMKNISKEELLQANSTLDQISRQLHEELIRMKRLLWWVTHLQGGTISIELNKPMPTLWKLATSLNEEKTHLTLEALVMPEPTPEQLDRLADELRGSGLVLGNILQRDGHEWPAAIIEHALSQKHVIFHNGVWLDAAVARQLIEKSRQ